MGLMSGKYEARDLPSYWLPVGGPCQLLRGPAEPWGMGAWAASLWGELGGLALRGRVGCEV